MSLITSRGATGPLAIQAGGSFPTSTDGNLATLVGTRWDLSDGREVMLVSTGATAISTAGILLQDEPIQANHVNLAVTTVTAYSANGNIPASIAVTLGATALTANEYQGGFAVVNAGAGIGQTLRIASHKSALASATNVTITLEDSPNTALATATSKVSLIPAHATRVVMMPTTATNVPVGVSLYPLAAGTTAVPNNSYGFVTSKGITSVLSDATVPAAGAQIIPSVTTAGAITVNSGTSGSIIGYALQAGVSAEARSVFINV